MVIWAELDVKVWIFSIAVISMCGVDGEEKGRGGSTETMKDSWAAV